MLSLPAIVLTPGRFTAATDAEAAKRMGSAKFMGMQRQATADKARGACAVIRNSPKQRPPSGSWMGPLAGLAAGLGLAAVGFFMHKRAAARRQAATGTGGMQYAHGYGSRCGHRKRADPATPAYKVALPVPIRSSGSLGIISALGSDIGSGVGSGVGEA